MAVLADDTQTGVQFVEPQSPDVLALQHAVDAASGQAPELLGASSFIPVVALRPQRRPRLGWLNLSFVWIASLLIHVTVFLGFLIAIRAISKHMHPPPPPMVIPDSFFHGGKKADRILNADIGKMHATARQREQLASAAWQHSTSPQSLSNLLQGGSASQKPAIIGLGSGAAASGGLFGLRSGPGGTLGVVSQGVGQGPETTFFGVRARAKTVVYIIDHSGSMINRLHLVKAAVRISVHQLMPFQRFAVIAFSDKYQVLTGRLPVAAKPVEVAAFDRSLDDLVAKGHNDDELQPFLQPFKVAFAMRPQAIYFLTDGHFDVRLLARVQQLEQTTPVRVYTLDFLDRTPRFIALMRRLAHETGGTFHLITRAELGGT